MYPEEAGLVYKIDHIGVAVDRVDDAFAFCRDALGLPVAWELASYGSFRTGGLGLGNLNLELLDAATSPIPVHEPAAIGLVAFERAPHTVDDLVAALRARGVEPFGPVTTGDDVFGFTNVFIPPLGIDAAFFCSYHYPGARDNAVRATELDAVGGGALGVRGATELRAALDTAACAPVLGAPVDGRFRFDTGPDLVVDPSVAAGTAEMTLSFIDPAAAEQTLRDHGAIADGDRMRVPALGDLALRVSEASPSRPADLAGRRARAQW